MNTVNNESAARRSKTRICGAFMKQLEAMPYHKITVSLVCRSAGVSRTAFYKNFESLEDVVRYKLLQIKKGYDRRHPPTGELRPRLVDFYAFAEGNKDIDLLIKEKDLVALFEAMISDSRPDFIKDPEEQPADSTVSGYLPGYLSATIVSLLRKWAESGYRETPEQMAEMAVRLIEGCLQLLPEGSLRIPETRTDSVPAQEQDSRDQGLSDILNNIPTGVCVLFMPDETHQEIRFANTQQMRLINPDKPAPEKEDPKQSALRTGYYKNAFSGVHPDDLDIALKAFHDGFHLKQFRVPPIRLKTGSGDYFWVAIDVTLRESLPEGKVFYASYRDITKEVQLQRELEKQRKKNMERTLLDTIGRLPACSVLYREEPDGTLLAARYSDEYLRFMGYDAQGDIRKEDGGNFLQSVYPEDRSAAEDALDSGHEDGRLHHMVLRVRIHGDGYKWVSVNFTRFSFSEERYLYLVFTDIDNLKKQERRLQVQYDDAQANLDSVSDTYLLTQRLNLTQNRIEAVHGQCSLLRGCVGQEYDATCQKLKKYLPAESDQEMCYRLFSRQGLLDAFDKGTRTRDGEFRFYTGQYARWLSGIVTLTKRPGSGDVIAFVAVSSIDEKKLTEAVIRKIVAEQCDYVACVDARSREFKLFFFNRRWQGKERVSAGADYDRTVESVFIKYIDPAEKDAYRQFMDLSRVLEALEENESVTALFHSSEGGGRRVKQLEFTYLDRASGLIAMIKTDITDAHRQQIEQEERLREALDLAEMANAAKSDFLSSMSHDLRTPLNGVLGFTAFALREQDPQKKQEYLEKIDSSGKLLLELINDTLDLSRIESGKAVPEPEPVMSDDLIPAVVTALRPSAELKGVRLVADLGHYKNELVLADKLKINKIALNLLSNAIKFTPSGGTITVTPQCAEENLDTGICGFVVEDTGIGMSEDFMKRMYEPFAQEKRSKRVETPGTGLGLAIVKRYVDLLGGTISVASRLNKGTRWTIALPIVKLKDEAGGAAKAIDIRSLEGRRVLLCEDNRMNTEIASILLKDRGILVETAENGAVGVKMFSDSADRYYDAVLMDIRMPVMNGNEAARKIRALDRPDAGTTPIIAMTADAFEESIREAKAAGMDAYITKPLDPQKMFKTIQHCIKE